MERRLDMRRGFTLIELIVVLAIIAVLTALIAPNAVNYMQSSAAAVCAANRRGAKQELTVELALNGDAANLDSVMERYADGCPGGGKLYYKLSDSGVFVGCSLHLPGEVVSVDRYIEATKAVGKTSTYAGRDKVIDYIVKNGGLERVSDAMLKAAGLSGTELYWRPYYIGSTAAPQIVLFAAPGNSGWNNWSAQMLYVDGQLYVAKKGSGSVAGFYNYKTVEELEKTLSTSFTPVN